MVERWWDEARRHQRAPARQPAARRAAEPAPGTAAPADALRAAADGRTGPRDRRTVNAAQPLARRARPSSRCPTARTPSGVLVAQGSVLGGWSLYLLDGRPRYVHNLVGKELHRVDRRRGRCRRPAPRRASSSSATATSPASVGCTSTARWSARRRSRASPSARFSITGAGLTCGYEVGPAVSDDYVAPFTLQRGRCAAGHDRRERRRRTATSKPSSPRSWPSSSAHRAGDDAGCGRWRAAGPRQAGFAASTSARLISGGAPSSSSARPRSAAAI